MAVVLLAGLACLAAAVVLIAFAGPRADAADTLDRSVATLRARMRRDESREPAVDGTRRLDKVTACFSRPGRILTPPAAQARIRRRLATAGLTANWTVERIVALKAVAAIGGSGVGLFLVSAASPDARWAVVLVGGLAAAGCYLPNAALHQLSYNRTQRIARDLPDVMDMLTISVEAGLAFDASLASVARETSGPLSQELRRVTRELQVGTGRSAVFEALADRTDVPELRGFSTSVLHATTDGLPLAGILRSQAAELRVRRTQAAEEAAQKVGVKIMVPLIFFIMPALLIVLMGPAIITTINSGILGR